MWETSSGQYIRFQDTKDFQEGYASQHCIWNQDVDDTIKDSEVIEARLYSNEGFRLKSGFIFCENSNAETDEEFIEESKNWSACSCGSFDYAIFIQTEEDVFKVSGDDGIIINLNKSKVIKTIKVSD